MLARSRRDSHERFRIAAKRHRDAFGQVRPRRQTRLQQRPHVSLYLLLLRRTNHTGKIQRSHQTYGAHRQLRALLDGVIAENIDFKAAPAKVRNAARPRFRASRDALVATARYRVTPNSSIISLKCRNAFTPFLNISSLKRCRRKTPSPSRSEYRSLCKGSISNAE